MTSDHKQRQVYLELKEIIDPAHTALLVWDVQNLLVERIFNQEPFLKNLKQIVEAARQTGMPVFYSKIVPLPREFEAPHRSLMMMRRMGIQDPDKLPSFLQPGTKGAEIHPQVTPAENDIVLGKHTTSMFIGTHFEPMLRNRGIESVIITGLNTEMGIASTARDASARGFYTVVAEEAVSTSDEEIHNTCLKILKRVVLVESNQSLMDCWGS